MKNNTADAYPVYDAHLSGYRRVYYRHAGTFERVRRHKVARNETEMAEREANAAWALSHPVKPVRECPIWTSFQVDASRRVGAP